MSPLPLQVPGGIELFIIGMIFVILAIPVALLVILIVLLRRRSKEDSGSEDRIDELEARVEELESELETVEREDGSA